MARKLDQYRVFDGRTRLDAEYFNSVFGDVDQRLHAQEVIEKDWKAAVAEVTRSGLKRIDDFIAPAISEIGELTSLGFLQVRAASDASVVWQTGEQAVPVSLANEDDRIRAKHFQPSPFVVVTANDDPSIYLIARTMSYNKTVDDAVVTAAVLTVDVQQVVGSPGGGSVLAPWLVSSPASTALLFEATEDAVAARDTATAARDTAVSARDTATAARDEAQTSRTLALGYRNEAETYRDEAKAYRDETVVVAEFDLKDAEAVAFDELLVWGS